MSWHTISFQCIQLSVNSCCIYTHTSIFLEWKEILEWLVKEFISMNMIKSSGGNTTSNTMVFSLMLTLTQCLLYIFEKHNFCLNWKAYLNIGSVNERKNWNEQKRISWKERNCKWDREYIVTKKRENIQI